LAELGSGLYRRGQAIKEGESLWSLIICGHQMEQVDMPGYLSNWKFLNCFASQETIRQGETSGHKSGGLVLVLALGPSAHPKNARDLTFQPFLLVLWVLINLAASC
jgi:hypothetical protein